MSLLIQTSNRIRRSLPRTSLVAPRVAVATVVRQAVKVAQVERYTAPVIEVAQHMLTLAEYEAALLVNAAPWAMGEILARANQPDRQYDASKCDQHANDARMFLNGTPAPHGELC